MYLSFVVWIPFALWVGVSDWTTLAAIIACWAIAVAVEVTGRRTQRSLTVVAAAVATMAAIGLFGRLFGPFIVVPSLAASHAAAFALLAPARLRRLAFACSCLPVLVPVALEALGVLDPSYRFENGAMIVLSHAVQIRATPALLFLALASVMTGVVGVSLIVRARDARDRAEVSAQLQMWLLKQVAPRVTREAFSGTDAT